jgi:uncharacterized protein (TIGR02722 family)
MIRARLVMFAAAMLLSGCGKEVVRGANDPTVDAHAMSTGLDKDDIQRMLKENLDNLRNSVVMNEWRTARPRPVVAVFPFQNSTTEHIDSQLNSILSEAETWVVDANVVDMISRERQNQMIAEVEGQQHAVFNHANVAKYGRQLGAKYFITGKVQANDERTEDARRVQYFFYMQVIEVETSVIKWQHKAYVTKMIK